MKKWMIGMVSVLTLAMAGCGNGGSKDQKTSDSGDTSSGPAVPIKEEINNEGNAINGGTLKVALVSDSPFQGIFSLTYYQDALDANLMSFSHESMFKLDNNNMISDKGSAKMDVDKDAKTATVTLRDNLKWSDGQDVTADDVIFSQELIGNPDYSGTRYSSEFENVEGMKEYHEGKADHISGIEKVDNKTVKFHLKNVEIGLKYGEGGIWSYLEPKHVLEKIPVKDIEASDALRKNPVAYGPFRVTKVVNGESVEYEANEYYYEGKPKIDKIQLTRVPSSNIVSALQNHQYDLVLGMPTSSYDTYKDIAGYQMATRSAQSYSYLGFKLGKWDAKQAKIVPDDKAKMADKSLRQAMGYAIDNDAIGTKFSHGLSWQATSLIHPLFGDLHDSSMKGYHYDPEKAKKLLADAGYKDTDNDGLVEKPDGSKLKINMAAMSGGETAEPIAQYYLQAFKQIGLDVQLVDNRLQEFQNFYDRVQSDDEAIDIFVGGWGLGTNPWPGNLYGQNSWNYTRWTSDKNQELLAKMQDDKAYDDRAYQVEQYKEWQEYMMDEAPAIPLRYSEEVMPINNRVKHFNWSRDETTSTNWNEVELTADNPVAK
ncbi:MAG: oligopeptide ABC transporter substrate-binding protein [Aerococcus sp.]|nr:oligopeptide ABC transporter substrate-binding protein [Aerococcus sp.]